MKLHAKRSDWWFVITSSPYPSFPLLVIHLQQNLISEWYNLQTQGILKNI